jgi:hypothetical protein
VLLLLLLLLIGEGVLLSLVARGAGAYGHLPLTSKLSMQRVRFFLSNLTCAAIDPRRSPETTDCRERVGFSLMFDCGAS